MRSVFSAEQKALLTEIFDRPDRLTEHAAEAEFKSRFCQRDGPFARENRLNKTQIKSWMSNEKARRAKQQLRSDLDDEASSGADVGGNAAVAGGRGGARGRGAGRGRGRGGRGRDQGGCGARGGRQQGAGAGAPGKGRHSDASSSSEEESGDDGEEGSAGEGGPAGDDLYEVEEVNGCASDRRQAKIPDQVGRWLGLTRIYIAFLLAND